ncbi:non-hydrolyzing UDP-N-acetylglucosamine 2-epimerase [Bradyrhizobium sp. SYSU BS000235]|uniref:non-hydrolyzing UDP-N-acetylglucosamine 2-epimerase n=1 Tax=Bradyrhizobium sp. SYSU BS000235 TaxID=3411332 RepID=UPI003C78C37A
MGRSVNGVPLKKILIVFGTRPEAIKMAPVVSELRQSTRLDVKVCVTAQHREILDQVIELFGMTCDFDLDVMRPNQTLDQLTARILTGMGGILDAEKPDVVLVHGDTTTTLATSLAAFYRQIPVGHVEAGLRSGSLYAPWPEEMNRRVTSLATRYHFAPTPQARMNLVAEGIDEASIHVTGNTVIDALLDMRGRIDASADRRAVLAKRFPFVGQDGRRMILVTGHRRENFGNGFENICNALLRIVREHDVRIVYSVHPNPNVREPVERLLGANDQITLIDPQDYEPFVFLMQQSYLIITDSGGVQEEAPSLGKPVLVMREKTERPEAVNAGTVILVGTDPERIFGETSKLLTDTAHYQAMAQAINPYGDGLAASRIRSVLES